MLGKLPAFSARPFTLISSHIFPNVDLFSCTRPLSNFSAEIIQELGAASCGRKGSLRVGGYGRLALATSRTWNRSRRAVAWCDRLSVLCLSQRYCALVSLVALWEFWSWPTRVVKLSDDEHFSSPSLQKEIARL